MFARCCITIAAVLLTSAAARAADVELVSGESLRGVHAERIDGRVRFHHPILGWIDIAAHHVVAVRADPPEVVPGSTGSPPDGAGAASAPPAAVPEPEWKHKAELGLNGTSGNTRSQDLRAAISALLELPEHRWKFGSGWSRSTTDRVTTKNQWYVEGLKDWMWADSRWFAFATARYDRDHFQEWDKRASIGVGPGYKLVDEESLKVRLRAGVNFLREWGSDDERWRPEGLLGADGTWQITESQSLEAAVTWYPDLRDSGEYRVVGSVAWSVRLSDADSLSLKIGAEDEYDTHRTAPFKKNDFKYFAAIQYDF